MQYNTEELKILQGMASKIASKVTKSNGMPITSDYVRKIWRKEKVPDTFIGKKVRKETKSLLRHLG